MNKTLDTTTHKPTFEMTKKRNFQIRKAAVLGAGVMGSRIAAHFANVGLEVVLLDLETPDLKPTIKSKPAAFYDSNFASRITCGNFEEHMDLLKDADLILEAIVENLDIKKSLFDKVEAVRKEGSIIASNTSGIPLRMMSEGRTEDFKKNFLGLHFFNPPRYLRLLEVIPAPETDPELIEFIVRFGDLHLGKKMVVCKDTPAFIANRVGLFALMKILELVDELDLTVEETDRITGPVTGKPKTGTFRLADLIGIDTTIKVKNGLHQNLPDDEANPLFGRPTVLEKVAEKGWFGDKTKQGFYKKVRNEDGSSEILAVDLKTMEYRPKEKVSIPSLGATKTIDDLGERLRFLYNAKDKAGELVKQSSLALFAYVSNRLPEIADELYKIDDALKAGFGWDIGPFETWDILGLETTLVDMDSNGIEYADWVKKMIDGGVKKFYKTERGNRYFYDIESGEYKMIPGSEELVILKDLDEGNVIWKNTGTLVTDIGEGVLNVEFKTKANAIGGEVVQGILKAIEIAENDGWKGVVIGNEGPNFSLGANLALMLMMAIEQEWDELNMGVKIFQNLSMRIRYSNVPVVVAPHHMTLGGGCEITLHADQVTALAETYIGLVEVGVGLIPAGGGTKELTMRLSDRMEKGDVQLNSLQEAFLNIGQAKVATSAHEAFDMNIFREGDTISMNQDRQLRDARAEVVRLFEEGYSPGTERTDIKVLGRTGLGLLYSGISGFQAGKYISEHDAKIAQKVAWVMCGGDLSGTQEVSESYLLDLEREAFLSLCGERKTLERIQHTLKTGKPLRN